VPRRILHRPLLCSGFTIFVSGPPLARLCTLHCNLCPPRFPRFLAATGSPPRPRILRSRLIRGSFGLRDDIVDIADASDECSRCWRLTPSGAYLRSANRSSLAQADTFADTSRRVREGEKKKGRAPRDRPEITQRHFTTVFGARSRRVQFTKAESARSYP